MDKEMLEAYLSKESEIRELKYKLEHLGEGDGMIGNDTILNYRSGYPVPEAVAGVDWGKLYRLENRYKNRIAKLEKECAEVEDFIEAIPDSLTRRIFRMKFLEGRSQIEIGGRVHLDQSRISRKIDDFLKNA